MEVAGRKSILPYADRLFFMDVEQPPDNTNIDKLVRGREAAEDPRRDRNTASKTPPEVRGLRHTMDSPVFDRSFVLSSCCPVGDAGRLDTSGHCPSLFTHARGSHYCSP